MHHRSLKIYTNFSGERYITEKVILEMPKFSYNDAQVPWQNLPFLTVTVLQEQSPLIPTNEEVNFLNVTVESIYNLPESFTTNLEYKAGTVIYTDTEVRFFFYCNNSAKNLSVIRFKG